MEMFIVCEAALIAPHTRPGHCGRMVREKLSSATNITKLRWATRFRALGAARGGAFAHSAICEESINIFCERIWSG